MPYFRHLVLNLRAAAHHVLHGIWPDHSPGVQRGPSEEDRARLDAFQQMLGD